MDGRTCRRRRREASTAGPCSPDCGVRRRGSSRHHQIHSYRQIFADGRSLPKDPNPAWFGYSVGRWDGDSFVVETAGFNDNVWLDNLGRPATGQLRVTERFIRRDFGRMDIDITIDDPKAYTRPWTVTQTLAFQPDTELLEYICDENNKYFQIIPK